MGFDVFVVLLLRVLYMQIDICTVCICMCMYVCMYSHGHIYFLIDNIYPHA